jgi:hypothetical protein
VPFVFVLPFWIGPEKTVTAAPAMGVMPSLCLTLPAIVPGWYIDTFVVVVASAVIDTDRTSGEYPVA